MAVRRLLLVALVALGACASEDRSGVTPTDDAGRREQAVEWYLRSISDDGRRVTLVYTISGVASGCEREGRVVASESDGKVTVIAYKSVTRDRNRACTEELGYVEGAVTLDEALGDRALVGCRPGNLEATEDGVCRDLERSRSAGIFESSPPPGGY